MTEPFSSFRSPRSAYCSGGKSWACRTTEKSRKMKVKSARRIPIAILIASEQIYFGENALRSAICSALACGVLLLSSIPMSAQSAQSFTNTLMPQPAKLTVDQGAFALTPAFTVAAPQFRDERLDAGIGRMLHRLEYETSIPVGKEIRK